MVFEGLPWMCCLQRWRETNDVFFLYVSCGATVCFATIHKHQWFWLKNRNVLVVATPTTFLGHLGHNICGKYLGLRMENTPTRSNKYQTRPNLHQTPPWNILPSVSWPLKAFWPSQLLVPLCCNSPRRPITNVVFPEPTGPESRYCYETSIDRHLWWPHMTSINMIHVSFCVFFIHSCQYSKLSSLQKWEQKRSRPATAAAAVPQIMHRSPGFNVRFTGPRLKESRPASHNKNTKSDCGWLWHILYSPVPRLGRYQSSQMNTNK